MQWERWCQTLHAGSALHSFEDEIADLHIFWAIQGMHSTFVASISPVLCLFQAQASKLLKKDLARCRHYLLRILEICSFVKVVPGSFFHTSPPMENKSECQRLFSKSSLINFELCVIGILVSQCVLCLAVEAPQLSFYANEPVRDIWQNLGWPGSMAFWTLCTWIYTQIKVIRVWFLSWHTFHRNGRSPQIGSQQRDTLTPALVLG